MAKVSKLQLASYKIPDSYFFPTRDDRNAAFVNNTIEPGTYCAVANNPNVNMNDVETAYWYLEQYNGSNWTLVSISDDYALTVTNEGLKALSDAQIGGYKLEISRVCIREQTVPVGQNVVEWTENNFKYGTKTPTDASRNLLVLDTSYTGNNTFNLRQNFSWRINLANGGMQYIVLLDVDTIALNFAEPSGTNLNPIYQQKLEYDVGAIGLFIRPAEGSNSGNKNEVLFAVGNLAKPVHKYTSTATRIGNSLKIYLNTTISNLGSAFVEVTPEAVSGIPEVVSEEDLQKNWKADSTPYNLYLVDDYNSSGIPALAVRKGDPSTTEEITWSYFTPNDNAIPVKEGEIEPGTKNYMVVAWNGGAYEPAVGKHTSPKPQGILVGSSIIYDGRVVNNNALYKYRCDILNGGSGYSVGEKFKITSDNGVEFIITVSAVNNQGKVLNYAYTPLFGDVAVNINRVKPTAETTTRGAGLEFKIISTDQSKDKTLFWNFSVTDINKPVYVSSTKPGELTTAEETPYFVGWCTGTNSIKLALDLRNEATTDKYGTTKYATTAQVINTSKQSDTSRVTVTADKLAANYLQITLPTNSSVKGYNQNNPIEVNTYTKYNKPIIGAGYDTNIPANVDVSFYGKSYRALWGDLAEFYRADRMYAPGTLITIGAGLAEITAAKVECNGIISDKPGYVLGNKEDDKDLPVALVGKVPVRFADDCNPQFGDRIYLSKNKPGCASTIPNGKCLGKIIDKGEKLNKQPTIMCSVRISF
jgi:hypothetical protein